MRAHILALPGALMLALGLAAPARAADPGAVREKAQICAGCHGADGISATPGVPSLAGQTDQFLQRQLVFLRTGRRQSEIMEPMAEGLSNTDIRNLGAYFAALPPPAQPAAANDDAALREAGAALARQRNCAACHLDSYEGKQAAPRLARQREDYLVKALSDYRSGARASVGVAAMNEVASSLSDDDIRAVSHFLSRIP